MMLSRIGRIENEAGVNLENLHVAADQTKEQSEKTT